MKSIPEWWIDFIDCDNYKDYFYMLKTLKKITDFKIALSNESRAILLSFCERIKQTGDTSMQTTADYVLTNLRKSSNKAK